MVYAVDGQIFVLSLCAVVGRVAHDLFCGAAATHQLLLQGGEFARTEA